MKTIPMSYVREMYNQMNPEGHWFDKATMRFFKTVLPKTAVETDQGLYFITRETGPSEIPMYSIRMLDTDTGHIETVYEFNSYKTRKAAMSDLKKLLTPDQQ